MYPIAKTRSFLESAHWVLRMEKCSFRHYWVDVWVFLKWQNCGHFKLSFQINMYISATRTGNAEISHYTYISIIATLSQAKFSIVIYHLQISFSFRLASPGAPKRSPLAPTWPWSLGRPREDSSLFSVSCYCCAAAAAGTDIIRQDEANNNQ